MFDLSLLPSTSTPNESSIEVKGYNSTWVNGVFSELKSFVMNHSSSFSKCHSHSVYDILLFTLGFPLSLWACSRLSAAIESSFGDGSVFLLAALYLYVFVGTLFVFRLLFHYLRWVCPLVEYKHKSSKLTMHRIILGTLGFGIIGNFLYDVIGWLTKI